MYTKFFATIIVILSFMAIAYCQVSKPQVIEPFMGLNYPGGAMGRVERVTEGPNGCSTEYPYQVENVKLANEQIVELPTHTTNKVEENYQNQQNNQNTESYTVPGTYDSMTAPRFQNTNFGPNISYDFPDQNMMASEPDNPLSLAKQVEGYEQSENNSYENVETKYAQVHEPIALPTSMDGPRENYDASPSGESAPQYKTYDRLIMSLGKNRLQGMGDCIRGDLPIAPDTNHCGWFNSRHANPSQSLCTGAMNVLAGQNEATDAIAKLISETSTTSTAGGTTLDTGNESYMQRVAESTPNFGKSGNRGGVGAYAFP